MVKGCIRVHVMPFYCGGRPCANFLIYPNLHECFRTSWDWQANWRFLAHYSILFLFLFLFLQFLVQQEVSYIVRRTGLSKLTIGNIHWEPIKFSGSMGYSACIRREEKRKKKRTKVERRVKRYSILSQTWKFLNLWTWESFLYLIHTGSRQNPWIFKWLPKSRPKSVSFLLWILWFSFDRKQNSFHNPRR